jgi:hypothetical protein
MEAVKCELASSSQNISQFITKLEAKRPIDKDSLSELSSPSSSDVTDDTLHGIKDATESSLEATSSPQQDLVTTTTSATAPAGNDPIEDHHVLPQVSSDLLHALARLLGLERTSLTRIPSASVDLARLLQAHPDLRCVLLSWCTELMGICASVLEAKQGSKGPVDKSWHDLRKVLKIWKAACDSTASKIE